MVGSSHGHVIMEDLSEVVMFQLSNKANGVMEAAAVLEHSRHLKEAPVELNG